MKCMSEGVYELRTAWCFRSKRFVFVWDTPAFYSCRHCFLLSSLEYMSVNVTLNMHTNSFIPIILDCKHVFQREENSARWHS